MNNELPPFLRIRELHPRTASGRKRHSLTFIDRTLKAIAGLIKTIYIQNDTASRQGLLQQLDPRMKLFFLFFLIATISLIRQIPSQLFVTAFLFSLLLLSKISRTGIYRNVIILSFFFGFLVILPASLNVFTKGTIIFRLIHFKTDHVFWIYHLPANIGITWEGCLVVTKFYLKVANSLTLTFLIIYSTPFNDIIKALRIFRIPQLFLLVITLTYKFIFILSQTTEEIYFAMKSRWWKNTGDTQVNKLIAGRITHIFRKSWIKYEEIYRAMVARGYTGTVYIIYSGKLKWRDVAFLILMLSVGAVCYFI